MHDSGSFYSSPAFLSLRGHVICNGSISMTNSTSVNHVKDGISISNEGRKSVTVFPQSHLLTIRDGNMIIYCIVLFPGLISKNQTSSGDKEQGGMTLRDLWENSSNTVNKPLAPIGGGLSVTRANAGEGW